MTSKFLLLFSTHSEEINFVACELPSPVTLHITVMLYDFREEQKIFRGESRTIMF